MRWNNTYSFYFDSDWRLVVDYKQKYHKIHKTKSRIYYGRQIEQDGGHTLHVKN